MWHNCKKCWYYKISEKQKCCCNTKKFDEKKLSKKTREVKKPKPIAQKSEKRKALDEKRGWFDILFKKIAKKRLDEWWNWNCEYCWKRFNIQELLNQTTCFAHILSRWDVEFVHLAMFENNIALTCWETCHKNLDSEIATLKIKKELKKRIESLEKIDVWDLQKYII